MEAGQPEESMHKPTRRTFLQATGLAAVSLGTHLSVSGCQTARRSSEQARKPNILFLLTDDQRNDALGCAGHPIIQTPIIDGLAREGVRFENAFVTTPICAASRASVLTSSHDRTHGYTFNKPPVPAYLARNSYPLLLRQAGYRTGFIGKYGCAMEISPNELFDSYQVVGRNPYFHKQPDGSMRHETDLCADAAIAFIEEHPSDRPFCLSVSFNAAHAEDGDKRPGIGHYPWPPSVEGMYEDVDVPMPRLSEREFFDPLPDFLKTSLNRKRYFWRWDTPEKYQTNMRAYFRMISGIDRAVGRIMVALARRALADNTVVIYAGDNGYYMGDRGFAGKWTHYEQALRVPMMVFDPRLPAKRRHRVDPAMVLNIDVPATIVDLAGIEQPSTYQGLSLLPLVTGQTSTNGRQDFFCEHLMDHNDIPKWEGVRGRRYVYARYFEQEPVYEFLHDLQEDPDQRYNLAGRPEYLEILNKLRRRTDELQHQYASQVVPPVKQE